MPTRRKLTVLKASAGFGKTTLLAECCRRLRRDGVPTAWVSLDEQDEVEVLDVYIAFACHDAGLDVLNVPDPDPVIEEPARRVDLVVRGIQTLAGPFVIALDEVERLKDPASVSLLEFLQQRGPSNLHLAIGGSVTGIEVDAERLSGSVTLGTANIGSSNSGFFEGRLNGTVEGIDYSGRWGGQFFGNSETDGTAPGSVGGTLGATSDDRNNSFVGVFGAYKQ